jgi:predicted TIM-barrel fold metal-dependent hydrolase
MNSESEQFIDAHHHLWDLQAVHYPWLMARGEKRFFGDPTAIQKNYLVADLLAESPHKKPAASVHIQVGAAPEQSLQETRWLHQQDDYPQAVVAFADLTAKNLVSVLDAQQAFPRVRGIRQIVGRHAEEDRRHGGASLPVNPAWVAGLKLLAARGLSFDLQMIPPQMPTLLAALSQVPELKVALCHCGSPWDQSEAGLASWRKGLRQLAQLPNVVCKVSGLGMFNRNWKVAQLQPLVLDVIDIFSPQRVMFGSNFPVDKLYRSYGQYWQAYSHIIAPFSPSERTAMLVNTAAGFYSIQLS